MKAAASCDVLEREREQRSSVSCEPVNTSSLAGLRGGNRKGMERRGGGGRESGRGGGREEGREEGGEREQKSEA